ncbi:MAG: glycosyl transferase, group 1 family [Caloramator sp.]|jgi:glycosyltransferase involved in cell wall biosynthesis|uniref:glycosyltransferase family 4 protein n=1 Tax=Caloramator sp. TaxID=1871330 RepID=UPI001D72EEB5|nr:glycosyltransferase family 4 protein [Caloramator sp.]MBZ4664698.1 glycosyl transferase, group 1 family [Caloramator sp.]
MKKILIISLGRHFGGLEMVILNLLENMDKNKFSFYLICLDKSKFQDYIRIHENIISSNIKIIYLKNNKSYAPWYFIKIAKILIKEKIHIVHCHGVIASFVGTIVGTLLNKKVITTIHSSVLEDHENKLKGRLYVWLENFMSQYNHKYITVSQNLYNKLVTRGINSSKLVLIKNGIPIREFKDKNMEYIQNIFNKYERDFKIGCIGRLEKVKGQDLLIQAMFELTKQYPDIRCWFIGQGTLENELKQIVEYYRMNNNIFFLGFRSEIIELINCMDVIVIPSRMEGLPILLLEAMSQKKCVIASNVGGIPEVIQDNKTGLLFSPGDVVDLVESISSIYKDREKLEKLGKQAYQYMREEYNITSMIEAYEKLYDVL